MRPRIDQPVEPRIVAELSGTRISGVPIPTTDYRSKNSIPLRPLAGLSASSSAVATIWIASFAISCFRTQTQRTLEGTPFPTSVNVPYHESVIVGRLAEPPRQPDLALRP